MNEKQPLLFDAHNIPLHGWNLIEASAGTGKTYALANLYLRLLAERSLSTRDILAVTFTTAATDELKGRIRLKIREALTAFSSGTSDDEFLRGILAKVTDHERAGRLLTEALRSFDEAAIYTIHGFCLRALRRCAFESGSLFDTELIEDEAALIKELVHDFWRLTFYSGSAQFLKCERKWVAPDRLLTLVRACQRNPFLRIEGEKGEELDDVTAAAEQKCFKLFSDAAAEWQASRHEVVDILKTYQGFSRNVYSTSRVAKTMDELDAYFLLNYLLPFPEGLQYVCFNPSRNNALKKGFGPPAHAFFDRSADLREGLDELNVCYAAKLAEIRLKLIRFIQRESSLRKKERNIRSYGDLLLDLFRALQGEGGDRLANLLRTTYRVALVDEFQDTDPLQYAIFTKIYRDKDATLFLIGDPKQAIYGFRGADVFAYISAAIEVDRRYTLEKNWRSSDALITAINALFEGSGRPFILDGLDFTPVEAGGEKQSGALLIEGQPDLSPLKLWFLRRNEDGKPIGKGFAKDLLNRSVVAEVARLLEMGRSGRASIDGRPVLANDMAIIVRTNQEAREIQQALRDAKIPGVIYSSESVFAGDEALELERILRAVSDPRDEGSIKAALATNILGVTGDELAAMTEKEYLWENWLDRFEEYHETWLNSGFVVMARLLIARERVKRRLRVLADGERRITNLLHCVELLHKASLEQKLGMEGLLKWLADKRQVIEGVAAEEYQIRLETDDLAVKIVTIHKSKGLEYPICFCPFLWADSGLRDSPVLYHDREHGCEAVLNVCKIPDDQSRQCAEQEQLAENIRLAYVALTRAKYRCYTAWGFTRDSETSALAYLLHARRGGCAPELQQIKAFMQDLSDQKMEEDLADLKARSGGSIEIMQPKGAVSRFVAAPERYTALKARSFTGRIERDWRVSSFSALTSGREELAEMPDRDQGFGEDMSLRKEGAEIAPLSIFDFPRGMAAGSCLHEILERVDFSDSRSDETRDLVADRLGRYGFASAWTDTICALAQNTLTVPLGSADARFTLSMVEPGKRLHELEFYAPLQMITPKGLAHVFRTHIAQGNSAADTIQRLGFKPVKGMLKGYIDLVFEHGGSYYIVDWKSNYLGSGPEEYAPERLSSVMERELYLFQYHIYAAALHRFLLFRLPGYTYDRHFGGVYYLFLRGLAPEKPEQGIYFDRPARETVEGLAAYLTGG